MMRMPVIPALAGAIALAASLAGALPASAETSSPLQTALLTALDDEYKAEATYQSVLDKFGEVRPFSNIVNAEKTHASMVAEQLRSHGWAVPANSYLGKVTAPATLLEACQTGVVGELENIALYDRLLPTVTDPAARSVLEYLQAASRDNHLPAFQRCVARGGTPGMGGGGGRGWHGGGR